MEWHDMVVDGYGRIGEILGRVLDGLSKEDLAWQPKPDANSIGWLAWHLTRSNDRNVSELFRKRSNSLGACNLAKHKISISASL